jgi:hypothetical protein
VVRLGYPLTSNREPAESPWPIDPSVMDWTAWSVMTKVDWFCIWMMFVSERMATLELRPNSSDPAPSPASSADLGVGESSLSLESSACRISSPMIIRNCWSDANSLPNDATNASTRDCTLMADCVMLADCMKSVDCVGPADGARFDVSVVIPLDALNEPAVANDPAGSTAFIPVDGLAALVVDGAMGALLTETDSIGCGPINSLPFCVDGQLAGRRRWTCTVRAVDGGGLVVVVRWSVAVF